MEEQLDFEEQIEQCREALANLMPEGRVPLRVSQALVQHSAYWNHPTAGWVNAPRDAERIEEGAYGHEVKFGSNSFLVEVAVTACIKTISDLLDLFEANDEYPFDVLANRLCNAVCASVSDYRGIPYPGPYRVVDGDMIFGTHCIKVPLFVQILAECTKIERMYQF